MQMEISVPENAVAVEGDAPAVGDSVSLAIDGKVSRVENGMIVVAPSTINGQPVEQTQESQPSLGDMRSSLESQYRAQDK